MLTIVIVSIIAAFAFAAEARKRGYYEPMRFGMYPILVGGGIYCVAWVMQFLVRSLVRDAESPLLRIYPYVVGLFSVILMFVVISKAWRRLVSLPKK